MKKKVRRYVMVEEGGVECYEIRLCQWFTKDGEPFTSAEVTVPEGHSLPSTHEAWGTLMQSVGLVKTYLEDNR